MSQRALIIGSDRDYCYVIKEFLELRELHVTVVLDYKDGLDRLSYERPELTIIEDFGKEIDPALIDSINTEDEFEVVDFINTRKVEKDRNRVLIFEDRNHITFLFNFLKSNYSDISDIKEAEASLDSEDKGSLRSTFYPCLLIDIYSKKRTGILSITSSANLHIYFVNGSPIFAEGGDIETAIGRILLDREKITRENYEKALDLAGEKKQRFGETLFEMGLISPHELNSYLELQMEEKIIRGFYYLSGEYVFNSRDNFTDRVVSYKVNLHKVVHEGVLRFIDAEPIEKENPTIEITPQLQSEINNLGLKPKELRFVQLLKNKASVKEVLETSTLGTNETLKLLYFLAIFKLLNISDISIDAIGRTSMKRRLKEREIQPEREKNELLLQFDEHGLFGDGVDTTETQSDFSDQPGEESLTGDAQVFGEGEDAQKTPTGVDAEEYELDDFQFLHNPGSDEGTQVGEEKADEPLSGIYPEDMTPEIHSQDAVEPETEKEEIISHIIDSEQPGREQEPSDIANDLPETHTQETGVGDPETAKINDSRQIAERVTEFYSTINKNDHYEVLGVEQDASGEEIRDAYYGLVKFYHPDVNPNTEHEIREKAEEIFTRITSAYETLIEPEKREEYDSREELAELKTNAKYIYEAEMAFKTGITLLIQRDYSGAEKKIREALDMNPDEPAYLGAHAWALFLSANDKSLVEEEAKKSLEKAISMNEKIPENYYYLGSIYKHANDLKKAEEYFNKALKLDPDYIEVKREIRLINTRKANSGNEKKAEKRFWSGLFKK